MASYCSHSPGDGDEKNATNPAGIQGRKRSAESKHNDENTAPQPPLAKLPRTSANLPEERKTYTLVDEEDQVEPALDELRGHQDRAPGPLLAVDCEGENLSRRGKLSLLSIGTEDHVFLFDIKKLGPQVFDQGLQGILEDADREKLMFDCRQDSDCLWHLFKVKLANVLDLQLLQVIYRQDHPEQLSYRNPPAGFQPMLRGFRRCLDLYVHDNELTRSKDAGLALLISDKEVFMKRPLEEKLLEYAAGDIRGSFVLYRELKGALESAAARANLKVGSQKYLDLFRGKDERDYGKYELNAFLPWGILNLPKFGHISSYRGEVTCTGCKRPFPRTNFSSYQMQRHVQKCAICQKVDARK